MCQIYQCHNIECSLFGLTSNNLDKTSYNLDKIYKDYIAV